MKIKGVQTSITGKMLSPFILRTSFGRRCFPGRFRHFKKVTMKIQTHEFHSALTARRELTLPLRVRRPPSAGPGCPRGVTTDDVHVRGKQVLPALCTFPRGNRALAVSSRLPDVPSSAAPGFRFFPSLPPSKA